MDESLVLQDEDHEESDDGSEDAGVEELLEQLERTELDSLATRPSPKRGGGLPDGARVTDDIFYDFTVFVRRFVFQHLNRSPEEVHFVGVIRDFVVA